MKFKLQHSLTITKDDDAHHSCHVTADLCHFTLWKSGRISEPGHRIRVYDQHFSLKREIPCSPSLQPEDRVATSPCGNYTAIAREGSIVVDGENSFCISDDRLVGACTRSAAFSADSRLLWIAQSRRADFRLDENGLVIQPPFYTQPLLAVIDTNTRGVCWDCPPFLESVRNLKGDKFSEFVLWLSPHPSGDMVLDILEFELQVRYWTQFSDGSFSYFLESSAMHPQTCQFDTDGKRYLVSEAISRLYLKSYPNGRLLRELQFENNERWDAAGAFEGLNYEFVGFISPNHALVSTADPKVLLVSLRTMEVVDCVDLPQGTDGVASHSSGQLLTRRPERSKDSSLVFERWKAIE